MSASKKPNLTRDSKIPVECRSREGDCFLAGADGEHAQATNISPVGMIDPQSSGVRLFWNSGKRANVRFWWLEKAERNALVEDSYIIPELPANFDASTKKLAIFNLKNPD
ncbi:hypothetical protein SI65_09403 [Aspergillus cristatus]|uniref:Uncharacterized protein n=1 Tax=Aspergillus cristatus TaxID=573508 RepID=A0A1E3B2L8_ASPCR|nr:hypothetical protein SI65_09403 [Aspergillus cristatus]